MRNIPTDSSILCILGRHKKEFVLDLFLFQINFSDVIQFFTAVAILLDFPEKTLSLSMQLSIRKESNVSGRDEAMVEGRVGG